MSSPILPAVFACFLWSTAFVAVKIGLPYYAPLQFAGVRFMLSGLMILPFCFASYKRWHLLARNLPHVLAVSLFQTILLYAAFFYGMTLVGGAQAAIIIGSSPLVSALAAHLAMKDDRMTGWRSAFIMLGIVGVAVISIGSKPWTPAGLRESSGMLLLFSGVVTSAAGNVIVARRRGELPAVPLNALQIFIGGAVLFVWGLLQEGPRPLPSAPAFWYALLWLSGVSAAAFTIWFMLLQSHRVSELNLWKFVIPVSGAVLSWLLLPDESPTVVTVTGILLVGAGVLGYYLPELKKKNLQLTINN